MEVLKQQGSFEDYIADCWNETVNTNHPYYWYEKAVAARLADDDNEVMRCLEKSVACHPDYLAVIGVARYADEEVKASKRMVKLFEMFYLTEMRKRK